REHHPRLQPHPRARAERARDLRRVLRQIRTVMITAHTLTVRALVDRNALERPQALYAVSTDEAGLVIRFGELQHSCRRVGALLDAHGVQPGDTVSLVMPNGLMTLRLLLGVMYGGRCVNPVNLLSQPEQMRYVIDHSDCKLVFVAPEWEARVRQMVAALGRRVDVVAVAPDALHPPGDNGAHEDVDAPDPQAAALLMYTSGTTGLPKGVVLTHANLAANAQAISAEHALSSADRVLAVLPLYHINAFVVTMLAPLAH